ncbi:MAG: DnaJ domain-containing protein [Deltaproteobacteria bacterium]|nr:DnaJ domain-containing protein [Deltaproteobacteria bacterium]
MSAEEGFILSQIDGKTSVDDLELITGLGGESLGAALERLLSLGLIETGPVVRPGRGVARPAIVPDRPPTEPPAAGERLRAPGGFRPTQSSERETRPAPASEPRGAAKQREGTSRSQRTPDSRREAPEDASGPREPDPGKEAPPGIDADGKRGGEAARESSAGPSMPPGARVDPATFTEEALRRIDTFLLRANSADFYRLLGVGRQAERPAIRSAYFGLAKEFHPDAYFGRTLGVVKPKLERIFRQITRAYEVLSRSASRKEYDVYLKGQAVLGGQEEEEQAWAEEERRRSAEPTPPSPEAAAEAAVGSAGAAAAGEPAAQAVAPPATGPAAGPPLSSPADQGIHTGARASVPPPRGGPSSADAWRRERTVRQLAAVLSGGRRRPVQDRRGADYLVEAESAAKEEEWGRVVGLLEAAQRLGLNEAEATRAGALQATAAGQLARISAGQARFAESTGDVEGALRHVEQACKFGPDVADHWDMRARLLLRLGRELHQARDAAMRAIRLEPKVLGYRTTMIRVYLVAGLPKNARREADAALEIDSSDRQIRALLEEAKSALE